MSDAPFLSAAGVSVDTCLRPSTPHSSGLPSMLQGKGPAHASMIQHIGARLGETQDLHDTRPYQSNQVERIRAIPMRGVITGPARWRGSGVSYGTPNLYCAVYKYSMVPEAESLSRPFPESGPSSPECNSHPLPPPTLVSSSWGQGPLVIEGVTIPKRPMPEDIDAFRQEDFQKRDNLQAIFVLSVGLFRDFSASSPSAAHISCSSIQVRNASASLPRPSDLLGVLHIPLHCVHLTELQHEVKLRLPVAACAPCGRNVEELAAFIGDEGERELAAILSPQSSLDVIEHAFMNGLTGKATGANRCNVMLFRLSSSGGSFLEASDAIFQAALAAPVVPSVASSTIQRSFDSHCYNQTGNKQESQHFEGVQDKPTMRGEISTAAGAAPIPAVKPASVNGARSHCPSIQAGQKSQVNTSGSLPEVAREKIRAQSLSAGRGYDRTSDSLDSAASPPLPAKDQCQRHQRRQQEISVAAMLAASAIAAAARGERDRTTRSSASRQLPQSSRLVGGAGLKNNQRPSSVCGVLPSNKTSLEARDSSLHVQPQRLGGSRMADLTSWDSSEGIAVGRTEIVGEPELSPDDSVSVRGDDTQRLAANIANRTVRTAHSLACVERSAARRDSINFRLSQDDRKSTLSTSIRRLDHLMARAQLLLSQRRNRQRPQEENQQGDSSKLNRCTWRNQSGSPQALLSHTCDVGGQQSGKNSHETSECNEKREHHVSAQTQELQHPPSQVHRERSAEFAQSARSPLDGFRISNQSPDDKREALSMIRAVKWMNAASTRRTALLTQREEHQTPGQLVLLIQHFAVPPLKLVPKASEHPLKGCERKQNTTMGGHEELHELRQLISGLQQQVQARDDRCQYLEKRSNEEQQNHMLELSALRQRVSELQEQIHHQRLRVGNSPVVPADDNEKERLLLQLQKSSQELRQLQVLVAEHAAAKARTDEEQRRFQKEFIANKERTKDLEQQLLLVDQQLAGTLKHVNSAAIKRPQDKTDTGLAQLVPAAQLGLWVLQQLQGMRDTLKVVHEKEPLGRTAEPRRQPPLEAANFAPLQNLSHESSANTEEITSRSGDWKEPCLKYTRGPQRPTTPQHHQPAVVPHERSVDRSRFQSHFQTCPVRDGSVQQPVGTLTPGRRQASPKCYSSILHHTREGQQASGQPAGSGSSSLEAKTDIERQQPLHTHQGTALRSRSQHLTEQLNRQRTHRQQLLLQCSQQQHTTPLCPPPHAPPSSQLQTSFTSLIGHPQVNVQNYAGCPVPTQCSQNRLYLVGEVVRKESWKSSSATKKVPRWEPANRAHEASLTETQWSNSPFKPTNKPR
ncbi:uncharacterized protein LOC34618368 [Cyclospora cayetanensis]|uniref:Uncharacterized protein LOC34618368 n=1 Tax=Cyclospora cayetanensis TaxID=88456 RepID=A0A6P6S326_9EIME|nr:uncharacterized protein LOC34618368 [Cyclospora cayetanensis]